MCKIFFAHFGSGKNLGSGILNLGSGQKKGTGNLGSGKNLKKNTAHATSEKLGVATLYLFHIWDCGRFEKGYTELCTVYK